MLHMHVISACTNNNKKIYVYQKICHYKVFRSNKDQNPTLPSSGSNDQLQPMVQDVETVRKPGRLNSPFHIQRSNTHFTFYYVMENSTHFSHEKTNQVNMSFFFFCVIFFSKNVAIRTVNWVKLKRLANNVVLLIESFYICVYLRLFNSLI